jgi:hypothetical protein
MINIIFRLFVVMTGIYHLFYREPNIGDDLYRCRPTIPAPDTVYPVDKLGCPRDSIPMKYDSPKKLRRSEVD